MTLWAHPVRAVPEANTLLPCKEHLFAGSRERGRCALAAPLLYWYRKALASELVCWWCTAEGSGLHLVEFCWGTCISTLKGKPFPQLSCPRFRQSKASLENTGERWRPSLYPSFFLSPPFFHLLSFAPSLSLSSSPCPAVMPCAWRGCDSGHFSVFASWHFCSHFSLWDYSRQWLIYKEGLKDLSLQ